MSDTTTIELTPDQARLLARAEQPPSVIDPITKRTYTLIPVLPNGDKEFSLHRRAEPIFDSLNAEDRFAVIDAVTSLQRAPLADWPTIGAEPLDGSTNTFFFWANDSFGVVVTRTEDGNVELSDIVRESLLQQIHSAR